jgi:NAD(P)-dependent dehydrogenase (short-subunit alcohol dehydrogenase family)
MEIRIFRCVSTRFRDLALLPSLELRQILELDGTTFALRSAEGVMDLRLRGKVSIVTGSASLTGYGRGIAKSLAQEGCAVVVADIDGEGAIRVAQELHSLGASALPVKVDVRNRAEVEEMVTASLKEFGKIDILINNAGTSSPLKPFVQMTKEDWDLDIGVNLYGQMNVAQAVLPHMISRGYGRIVNISGGQGIPNISVYGAAKAGIVAFTRALAAEVAQYGIIVNCVVPGLGDTGLTASAPKQFKEAYKAHSMLKRLCTPEDVGPLVAFLSSDVCSYMSGQVIYLSTQIAI